MTIVSNGLSNSDDIKPSGSSVPHTEVNPSHCAVVNPQRSDVNTDTHGSPALTVYQAAQDMHMAGLNVVPVRQDGSKTPELPRWTAYQRTRTTPDQLWAWFASNQATGIGVIYGAVSGNTELLEFEGRAVTEGVLDHVSELMETSGFGEVWDAITTGWTGQSPSGGMHFRFRVEGTPVKGNTKLASRPLEDRELDASQLKIRRNKPDKVFPTPLIETRGEGGFGVCEPSHGKVHPSGKPYLRLSGGPATMPVIDGETYTAIHDICRAVDQMPRPQAAEWRGRPPLPLPEGQLRPGDAYNQSGDVPGLIQQHGWTFIHQRGDTSYWCRPGKDRGISASFNYRRCGKLYVFTSSTEFDNERAYSPFAAYAVLEHGGNFTDAARDLGRQGYGAGGQGTLIPAARQNTASAAGPVAELPDEPDPVPLHTYEERVDAFGINYPDYRTSLDIIYGHKPDQMGACELFTRNLKGGEHLRWNDEAGKFYSYTDGHWNEDGEKHTAVARKVDMLGKRATHLVDNDIIDLRARIKGLVSGAIAPREGLTRDDETKNLTETIKARPGWYKTYRSAGGRSGIIEFIKTAVDTVTGEQMDADPHLLNFANGTYDVRTGKLTEHDPGDYLTHRIARDLNLSLTDKPLDQVAPLFSRTLNRACAAEGEVDEKVAAQRVAALKRGIGSIPHGSNPEKKLIVLKGASNTGKTVVVNVIKVIMGHTLATEAKPTLLIRTRNERHEAEEYKLKGRRLVLINELESKMSMDEGQVLRLINPSGSKFTVRKLREQQQDINMTWSVVVTTNELLKARVTPQVLNRLTLYPMSDVSVPDTDIDPTLFDRIMEGEADAVLAHIVVWWREWYQALRDNRTGLIVTDEMRAAVENFRDDNASSDQMFRDERTEADPGGHVKASDIWSAFNMWLLSQRPEARREFEMGRTAFFKAVESWDGVETVYAHKKGRNPVRVGFRGLTLVLSAEKLSEMAARAGQ